MYFSDRQQTAALAGNITRSTTWSSLGLMSGNILFLGLTSMFTDISSEMIAAILPIYLTFELRLSAIQFGIFDGMYQGMSILLRLVGGLFADRTRRYKEVATVGYAVSTICKVGLLLAQSAWLPTTAFLFLDRLGKGIRTAPRDALISLSSTDIRRAEAFGVHRALDAAGALVGPLVAFALLNIFPGAFYGIFIVSFCIGLLGLATLMLFVENRQQSTYMDPAPSKHSWATILMPLCMTPFRHLLLIAMLLSVLSVSDAFVYLTFQRISDLNMSYFPLLYLGTALIYLLLAIPLGRLADRIGRQRVFLGGYGGLLGVYAVLLLPQPRLMTLLVCLALLGAYYAATEGVLIASASELLPSEHLASGLALLTSATILSRLIASILYGALWSWQGPYTALLLFAIGLAAVMVCTIFTIGYQSKSGYV